MTPATVGLFEGYGGLTMAVREVFGAELIAYSEIDPAASRVLAHHHPDVPNLGDITAVDWAAVPLEAGRPVILTGGFPCQDLSLAGLGAGLRPGTRSGLWSHMAYAIDQLRPDLVVIENVRGLLSASAACDLEPCPWCVGDDEGRPLRALGAVLGDLADIGYDARWVGLRAADVGAPHGRFRVFVAAWPVGYADSGDRDRRRTTGLEGEAGPSARPAAHADGAGRAGATTVAEPRGEPEGARAGRRNGAVADAGGEAVAQRPGLRADEPGGVGGRRPDDGGMAPVADAASDGRGERRPEPARLVGGPDAAVSGAGAATDTDRDAVREQPVTESGRGGAAVARFDRESPADTDRDGREGGEERDLRPEAGESAPRRGDPARRVLEWGAYEPAIRRWELILGRPAPAPTQTGARGGQQLSARFVEWLMGLPDGLVTDPEIGLTRNEQLARLGNGVVPQQAAAALRHLLAAAQPDRQRVAS